MLAVAPLTALLSKARPRRWHPNAATTHQHSLPEPVIGGRNSALASDDMDCTTEDNLRKLQLQATELIIAKANVLNKICTLLLSCNGGRFTRHFQIPAGQRSIGTRRACK
jgi:hypothetical protein